MQKNTLKFVLFKSKKKGIQDENKSYPIYLRLTVRLNGKTDRSYSATGYKVKEEEWNPGLECVVKRKDAKTINAALGTKLRAQLSRLADLERIGTVTHKSLKAKNSTSFYKFYRSVTGNRQMTKNNIVRISNYLYGDPVPYKYKRKYKNGECGRPLKEPRITDIDAKWLQGFENFLRDVHKYKESSIITAILDLQAALNHAERHKVITRCPIHKNGYRKPKKVDTERVYLTTPERLAFVGLLEKKHEFKPNRWVALVYFLFGCHTGLRQSDWRRFDPQINIEPSEDGDNIVIRAKKNKRQVVLPIGPTLQRIIDEIKVIGPLILPYNTLNNNIKALGRMLNINKTMKTHVARHSTGLMLAENKDVDKEIAAHHLGVTLKTMDTYYHLTGKHIMSRSKALRAI